MTDLRKCKEFLGEVGIPYEEDVFERDGINSEYYNDICSSVDPNKQIVLQIDGDSIAAKKTGTYDSLNIVFSSDGEFMFFEPYSD